MPSRSYGFCYSWGFSSLGRIEARVMPNLDRTGEIITATDRIRVFPGDDILLARSTPAAESSLALPPGDFLTSCSIPEILDHLAIGNQVWIDDGKIGATVIDCQPQPILPYCNVNWNSGYRSMRCL
ncbi:MAG TPA: hypothetical protein V6C65_34655 [Allocoleopsis sp.]